VAAIDDVWEHAQNVRMWLQTALDALGDVSARSFGGFLMSLFTRGQSRTDAAATAIDAVGKASLAYLDLEQALKRAEHAPLPLASIELYRREIYSSSGSNRVNAALIAQLRSALAQDLPAVDALAEEIERLQRQRRSPELR
jgi:hypothetical protein